MPVFSFESLVAFIVFTGGFANILGLGHQAWKLYQKKNSEGHSLVMYAIFIYCQASMVANAFLYDLFWQGLTMGLSMLVSTTQVILVIKYRPRP